MACYLVYYIVLCLILALFAHIKFECAKIIIFIYMAKKKFIFLITSGQDDVFEGVF